MVQDEPAEIEDDNEWFPKLKFVFARTMPEMSHEYTIRREENWDAFMKLWDTIGKRGCRGHPAAGGKSIDIEATDTGTGRWGRNGPT